MQVPVQSLEMSVGDYLILALPIVGKLRQAPGQSAAGRPKIIAYCSQDGISVELPQGNWQDHFHVVAI